MDASEYQKMYAFENDYWWYRGLHELVRFYIKTAPGGENRRIFDAGCGTGRTLEWVVDLGQVEGLDYSAQAIELCKKRGLEKVTVADLNTWKGEKGAYDALISLDVICTDGIVNETKVLEEFYRVLKPGGKLILNLPAFILLRRQHDLAVSGLRRYRKKATISQLRASGFEIDRAGYRLPFLFIIILIRKLFESQSAGPVESDLRPLPAWLNKLLLIKHRLDSFFFRHSLSLPFGSSLFIVCHKHQ